ncbi:MAG: SGNH/GDSL hydrolase family protein [Muribaculaceae bacterium]|nr:SGNH/GDSL hydrolase family protein [Muribaculaceae bacterium]
MKFSKNIFIVILSLLLPLLAAAQEAETDDRPVVRKVLFIGDSMTGWLAERLNAYGNENGFEVATVVWDGSTIRKWGSSPRLVSIIGQQDPDAIFISLGMNELFEADPEKRLRSSLDAITGAAGDIPVVWIGPPSWPGHDKGDNFI